MEFKCKYCNKEHKTLKALRSHERLCKSNPNHSESPFANLEWQDKHNKLKVKKEGWRCCFCNQICRTRNELKIHKKEIHNYIGTRGGWNKGLTAKIDLRIKNQKERTREKINSGILIIKGHKHTEESKQKISNGMKKAHAERRAGEWLGRNKKSYAEEFFSKVIENEFDDKNYIFNYHFGRYWLDFAWLEKRKCIEIDGSQHKRYLYQIENDKRKDSLLIQNNWEILRIDWKDLFNNTKEIVKKAKNFIGH